VKTILDQLRDATNRIIYKHGACDHSVNLSGNNIIYEIKVIITHGLSCIWYMDAVWKDVMRYRNHIANTEVGYHVTNGTWT